jgi:ligand-binding SRPBCC domain-containing protein
MPTIRIETFIAAPAEVCFDLARDTTIHQQSVAHTGERVVGAPAHEHMELGDVVTWEATHFGIRQRLTARITRFDPPNSFVDEMVRGAFHAFVHTHEFIPAAGGTQMIDTFAYTAPLGPLGKLADALFLTRYMQKLLAGRCAHLKAVAESGTSAR